MRSRRWLTGTKGTIKSFSRSDLMLTLQSTLIPSPIKSIRALITVSTARWLGRLERERFHLVIYLPTLSPLSAHSPHCLKMRALSDCDSLTHILPVSVLSSWILTSRSVRDHLNLAWWVCAEFTYNKIFISKIIENSLILRLFEILS